MLKYDHVDVFTNQALMGNGLTVVHCNQSLEKNQMLKMAQEFKQFETIFVERVEEKVFLARIFTKEEELVFAGHPILGAAACIHERYFGEEREVTIYFELPNKRVETASTRVENSFKVTMKQGSAEFLGEVAKENALEILKALHIEEEALDEDLPLEVVSTGLPYLIIPLKSGLEDAKLVSNHLESLLAPHKAKFAYIFTLKGLEARAWDNMGMCEDVATGSAAGPLCAYLIKHHKAVLDETIMIHQGRFVDRPSIIEAWGENSGEPVGLEIVISGGVALFASGTINLYK